MTFKSCVCAVLVSAVSIAIIGCAKAPDQELNAAKAAIDSAKVLEADTYSAVEFTAASDSLAAAIEEIEKQKSGLVGRNYDKARLLISSAMKIAQHARTEAVNAKLRMQADVDTSLVRQAALIAETKQLLAKAPKNNKNKSALEAIGNEMAALEASETGAQNLKSSGNLVKSLSMTTAGLAKLDSVKVELETATGKTPNKKSKK